MDKFYYIIEKETGKIDCMSELIDNLPDGFTALDVVVPDELENPHWDFKEEKFYSVKVEDKKLSGNKIDEKIKTLNYQMAMELSKTDYLSSFTRLLFKYQV